MNAKILSLCNPNLKVVSEFSKKTSIFYNHLAHLTSLSSNKTQTIMYKFIITDYCYLANVLLGVT